MKRYLTRMRLIFTCLAGVVVFACNMVTLPFGATDTPEATPMPIARPGRWNGTLGVTFDITEAGLLENFQMEIGECRIRSTQPLRIFMNMFSLGEIEANGRPVNDGIIGTFRTETSLTGVIASPYVCKMGGITMTMYLPEELTVWSAEWEGP